MYYLSILDLKINFSTKEDEEVEGKLMFLVGWLVGWFKNDYRILFR